MSLRLPEPVQKRAYLAIPLLAAALFSLASLAPFFGSLESQVYDAFLRARPAAPMSDLIRLVDVDDAAVSQVGSWPWPRDLMADGILAMREAGVAAVLFDIEYPTRSPAGVDLAYMDRILPAAFRDAIGSLAGDASDLVDALASGALPAKTARRYAQDLKSGADSIRDELYRKVRSIARDNDAYLGGAAKLAGNAYFAVNMTDDAEEAAKAPLPSFSPAGVKAGPGSLRARAGLVPPIPPIAQAARGVGYVNVVIDPDGKRRRIELAQEAADKPYLQLVMRPLLDILGSPSLEIERGKALLRGAEMPDGTRRDLSLPLGPGATMLISWPKEDYYGSFRHLSFYELVNLGLLEEDLVAALGAIAGLDVSLGTGEPPHKAGSLAALALLAKSEEAKRAAMGSGDRADVEAWLAARTAWIESARIFLAGDSDKLIEERIDLALVSKTLKAEEEADAQAMRRSVESFYRIGRDVMEALLAKRAKIASELGGKLCIVGWTSTGTTDLGTNPFHKEYVNVGTHAAVANTILNADFVSEAPRWISIVAAFVAAILSVAAARRANPGAQALVGLAGLALLLGADLALFCLGGVYVGLLVPALSTLFASIAYSVVKYLGTEKEKSFYRKAFSTYLSPAVIDELVNDPSKLSLGGQKRRMTALFTDIKGFSSISERLDPTMLVALLNEYLSGMSDIVLDALGTIDKYEGDAIIAFFGAPAPMEDHAARALRAAVLMKRKEAEMNAAFMERGLAPKPLQTRIGINTGEMVVGNMGTSRKMDYTIMGNAVNLAARLEGVNKKYGTWIMASDATVASAGGGFLARRLDRVRVVNINTPVQLWEILDIEAEASEEDRAKVAAFHEALDLSEARDFKRAAEAFAAIASRWPEDGPARLFAHRAAEFAGPKPPPANWDGVFNLNEK